MKKRRVYSFGLNIRTRLHPLSRASFSRWHLSLAKYLAMKSIGQARGIGPGCPALCVVALATGQTENQEVRKGTPLEGRNQGTLWCEKETKLEPFFWGSHYSPLPSQAASRYGFEQMEGVAPQMDVESQRMFSDPEKPFWELTELSRMIVLPRTNKQHVGHNG